MFGEPVNKAELSDVAKEVLSLLEKYQARHQSARNVLSRDRMLIERAINGEIDTPIYKGFFPEEFWEDGDLFQYDDLGDAVANFSLLLKGAKSINEIKSVVHDIENKAAGEEADWLRGINK